MTLEKQIESDLIQAMKNKEADKLSTLRMVKTAITNSKIAKKTEILSDADLIDILQKQLKQRVESFESFEKAGRKELADKEKREMEFLSAYLPKQLDDAAVQAVIQKAMDKTGIKSKTDVGRLMKEVMPELKGKADGRRINEIALRLLT